MDEHKVQLNDHDLLITLNVRVQDLINTINRMDGNMQKDIGELRGSKLDKTEYAVHITEDQKEAEKLEKELATVWVRYDEHTKKIDFLNRIIFIGLGGLGVLQFLAPFVINKLF